MIRSEAGKQRKTEERRGRRGRRRRRVGWSRCQEMIDDEDGGQIENRWRMRKRTHPAES